MELLSTWRASGYVKTLLLPIPLLTLLVRGLQEQVQSNADLDIPTQQELLAQFRCDEIAAVAISAFGESLKTVKRPVETGQVVEGLGGMLSEWKTAALSATTLARFFHLRIEY